MLGITEVAVVLPPPSLGDNYHSWCSGNSRESGAKNTQTAEADYGVGYPLSDIRADYGGAPPGAGNGATSGKVLQQVHPTWPVNAYLLGDVLALDRGISERHDPFE